MKEKIKNLIKDQLTTKILKIFLVEMIAYLIVTIWKWRELSPQIPLFYSIPRSGDQLISPLLFLILPVFSLLFFILNFMIASFFYEEEKLAAYLMIITGIIISFLLFITYIKITFLIT